MLPLAFIIRVRNHLRLPGTLVIRVVNHRSFPFSILLIIPVIRFLCIGIRNFCWNIIVTFWFHVLRVRNLLLIDPISRLRNTRIFNFLRKQEIPVLLQRARLDTFVINEHFEGVVFLDMKGVQVGQLVRLYFHLVLDQQIVILRRVIENHVRLLVAGSANIRTKHNLVWGVTTKFALIHVTKKLDICTATIKVLLVLHCHLQY
mmetsp:Transcript_21215/g.35572  ORF Transcript_21215/g.35572 Transcript_21215/m.35572 type:complete len:203 (-) Transcript_21215:306-914(-)